MTSQIGAGLAPVRTARPVAPGERIHVIGIGGAGASAAAILAARSGAIVTGCDAGGPSPYTDAVLATGIAIEWEHDLAHVTSGAAPDRLSVTKALTAIDPDHAELRAARDAGIPVEPWQQVIADVAVGRRLIGVAGTHGKSSTAGWLVHVLTMGGADPTAFVGALLPPSLTGGPAATARWGLGPDIVVEADEYAGNFDPYRPDIVVLTSAEWDHPDVFADDAAVVDAFATWLQRVPAGATVVADRTDSGVRNVLARLESRDVRVVGYGVLDGTQPSPPDDVDIAGRILAADPAGTSLEIRGLAAEGPPSTVHLAMAGRHNASNALAVAGAARAVGLGPEAILDGLAGFTGVGRRLERKGEAAGVVMFDDYAHHPTAIRTTIGAIRQLEPKRRVWAVYEPLTYHRTAALLDAFADALSDADAVAIADIWAGRDPDTSIASAEGLAIAVQARRPDLPVAAPGDVDATAAWLSAQVRAGDVVLVMGGGRSYRIAELLLERLQARET